MKDTKSKLLNIATKMFAQRGFNGVSTRDLAKQAKVNLCSIHYYFGGKKDLYNAVIDDVIELISDKFKKPLESAISVNHKKVNSPQEEIKFLIERFFGFLCCDNISTFQSTLLVSEILNPSETYNKFYTKIFEPLHKYLSRLIALDLNLLETDPKVLILAHTILGQVVMFRIHGEALLRRMNIRKYTDELLDSAKCIVQQNCEAILNKAKEGI